MASWATAICPEYCCFILGYLSLFNHWHTDVWAYSAVPYTNVFHVQNVSFLVCPRSRYLYRKERLPPGRPVKTASLGGRHCRIPADSHRPSICCSNHEPLCCACHVARSDNTFLSSVSDWQTIRFLLSSGFCASLDEKTVQYILYRCGHGLLCFKFWLARALVSKEVSELSTLLLLFQFTFVIL
jgi:hypothetical protein